MSRPDVKYLRFHPVSPSSCQTAMSRKAEWIKAAPTLLSSLISRVTVSLFLVAFKGDIQSVCKIQRWSFQIHARWVTRRSDFIVLLCVSCPYALSLIKTFNMISFLLKVRWRYLLLLFAFWNMNVKRFFEWKVLKN